MPVAWTDYPMACLGDKEGEEAPLRKVYPIMYDKDKYCKVFVPSETDPKNGFVFALKRGYLYAEPKPYDDKPQRVAVEHLGVELDEWLELEAVEG